MKVCIIIFKPSVYTGHSLLLVVKFRRFKTCKSPQSQWRSSWEWTSALTQAALWGPPDPDWGGISSFTAHVESSSCHFVRHYCASVCCCSYHHILQLASVPPRFLHSFSSFYRRSVSKPCRSYSFLCGSCMVPAWFSTPRMAALAVVRRIQRLNLQ